MKKTTEKKLVKGMQNMGYELYFVDEIILNDYVSNREDYYVKTKIGYNYYMLDKSKQHYTVYKFTNIFTKA